MIGGVVLLVVLVIGWKKGWFMSGGKSGVNSQRSPCQLCEGSVAFQSGVSDCSSYCA